MANFTKSIEIIARIIDTYARSIEKYKIRRKKPLVQREVKMRQCERLKLISPVSIIIVLILVHPPVRSFSHSIM